MGKVIILVSFIMSFSSCAYDMKQTIAKSKQIIHRSFKEDFENSFYLMLSSPVKQEYNLMMGFFRSKHSTDDDKLQILYYLAQIHSVDLLFNIINNQSLPDKFRILSFYFLADIKSKKLLSKEYESFISHVLEQGRERGIADSLERFYSSIPFSNKSIIESVRKIFLNTNNGKTIVSTSKYLKQHKKLSNKDILRKLVGSKGAMRSYLLQLIDITENQFQIKKILKKELSRNKHTHSYMVALLIASDLEISENSFLKLFNNPSLLQAPFSKIQLANIVLRTKSIDYKNIDKYFHYFLKIVGNRIDDGAIDNFILQSLLQFEKKFHGRTTNLIRRIIKKGPDEAVFYILRYREIETSEMEIVSTYLDSSNKKLKLLAALRILRAFEIRK